MRRREFLHGLVGRPGRFEVAVWIFREAGTDYFTQRHAVIGVGDIQGEVRSNLEALYQLGLLEKRSNGRPYYRRVESPVWAALANLSEAVDALAAGTAEPRLERDPPQGLVVRAGEGNVLTAP